LWGEQVDCDLRREGFVTVSNYCGYAGEGGKFFGCALRVTAGDDDAGLRIEAMSAANEGAGGAVGLGGDAAGIDDYQIGGGGAVVDEAGGLEMVGNCFAIGASGATAEVLDVERSGHSFSVLLYGWSGVAMGMTATGISSLFLFLRLRPLL
jgi:hypothetical protein